jgi:Nif-specific ferredoxin III
MMTGLTRDGTEWIPAFVIALNQNRCIGCGRCYKVCARDVFELIERCDLDVDDEDMDDDFDEAPGMVMSLKNMGDCIGCKACSRVCPKKCLTHSPQELAIAS